MKMKLNDCLWKKWLVFAGLMFLLIIVYTVAMKYVISQKKMQNLPKDDFSFVFQVDKVWNEEGEFVLDAWAFKLGEEANEGAIELWLYDMDKEKIVYPKTIEYAKRIDVNEYFLCEHNYTDCGIVTKFNEEKLDLSNKDYRVLVSDIAEGEVYQTGTYISKGELMYCLPEIYNELEVAGTDIENVVNNGVLRVYRPDFGMYVYQYEGELYWIAEQDYGFVNEDTNVQFQMYTTQIDQLPENRLANNWFWSNIGFRFKSKELTEWNTGKYRVAKCALPKEYSITQIWTGNHIEGWIWRQDFRPWYDFAE